VIAAHNEFCTPTVDEAIEQVIADGAHTVVVVPTMLLRGNSHTESEIHQSVIQARQRHPAITIHYALPFEQEFACLMPAINTHIPFSPNFCIALAGFFGVKLTGICRSDGGFNLIVWLTFQKARGFS
jgi:hypothetical protein